MADNILCGAIFLIGALVGLIVTIVWKSMEGVCCGPRASRRIDVAYPPGIRIGLTGPWTKETDSLDRSFFDNIQ